MSVRSATLLAMIGVAIALFLSLANLGMSMLQYGSLGDFRYLLTMVIWLGHTLALHMGLLIFFIVLYTKQQK
jgi:hypothetical protein